MGLTAQFAFGADKLPIPSSEQVAEFQKLIREVYRNDFVVAGKTGEAKAAFAAKLLKTSAEEKDDTARYILLTQAKDLAVEAGDIPTAVAVTDMLANLYDIDTSKGLVDMAADVAKNVTTPEGRKEYCIQVNLLTDEAIRADRFDQAKALNDLGLTMARTLIGGSAARYFTQRVSQIKDMEAAFVETAKARETLAINAADADACATVGRYYAMVIGDWKRGLPLLDKGNDSALQALANMEHTPFTPEQQVALANGWWELGEKEKGVVRYQLRQRASMWYARTLSQLTGLARARVEMRIADADADYAKSQLDTGAIWLTTLKPVEIKVGCWSLGVNRNSDPDTKPGMPTVDKKPVSQYLFAHAPSSLKYRIPSGATAFKAVGGCWNYYTSDLSFIVKIDGKEMFRSHTLEKYPDLQVPVFVKLPPKAKEIELLIDDQGRMSGKWSMWCWPTFVR